MYWCCESSSWKGDYKIDHNLIDESILRSRTFEALSFAERELMLGWREIQWRFAYFFCLYAREKLRWACHNKINMINSF
jgi:hypothetical protein